MFLKTENTLYNKWQSRTWILTVVWTSFIPLSIIAQILIAPYEIEIPLTPLVTAAGALAVAFTSFEKWRKGRREALKP